MDMPTLRKILLQNTIKSSLFFDNDAKIDPDVVYAMHQCAGRNIYFIDHEIFDDEALQHRHPELYMETTDRNILFKRFILCMNGDDPVDLFYFGNDVKHTGANTVTHLLTDCYVTSEAWNDFCLLNKFVKAIDKFKGTPMLTGIFKSLGGNLLAAPAKTDEMVETADDSDDELF